MENTPKTFMLLQNRDFHVAPKAPQEPQGTGEPRLQQDRRTCQGWTVASESLLHGSRAGVKLFSSHQRFGKLSSS